MSNQLTEIEGRLEVIRNDLARNARPWYGTDIEFLLSVIESLRSERDEARANLRRVAHFKHLYDDIALRYDDLALRIERL